MKSSPLLTFLIGLSSYSAIASAPHSIEPMDYFSLAAVSDQAISPDGKQLAWIEKRWQEQLDRKQADIWLLTDSKATPKRLTFSNENESSLQWAKDGSALYFKANYPAKKADQESKTQIYRLRLSNGAIEPMTSEKEGIKQYQLSDDGKSIYYSIKRKRKTDDPFAKLRSAHTKPLYGDGESYDTPIFVLDLVSYRSEEIYASKENIWDFDISSDNSKLALITTDTPRLIELEGRSNIEVVELATGHKTTLEDKQWREQAPTPRGWLEGVEWAKDGKALAFRIDFDGYPGQLFASEYINGKYVSQHIQAPQGVTLYGGTLEWRGEAREICLRGAKRDAINLYCVEDVENGKYGDWEQLSPEGSVIYNASFSQNGKNITVLHNSTTQYPEIYQLKRSKLNQLTHINAHTENWEKPQIKTVRWTSKDGTPVEGVLELPPHYKASDGPLPLVVAIHGGPTSMSPKALRMRGYGHTTFAAKGWALLAPNYRGSVGYGDKFLTDLVGQEHSIEVDDIMSGVDYLIHKGIADESKMAVMGWSNGGFLTNAIIASNNRFKAASSGAGVFDQGLQFALEDTPGHVLNFMEDLPWNKPEAYLKASPLYQAGHIQTPTLIHVGEADARVPAGHARTLYRVLKDYLNVPTELLVYPGEPHGLTKYSHKKAKILWDHAWFNHYVLGKKVEK